jgi:hypothetical protein
MTEAAAPPGAATPTDDDRLDALLGRLNDLGVVDADEVAAFLEESGITDQVARRAYREPDIFALAERLHARLWAHPVAARHAAAPVRWDWRGLGRPPMLAVRLVAAAALAGAVWWLGFAALVPALLGVPLAESLAAWHQGHVWWGLVSYDTTLAWRRYLRGLGWTTLAALTPPLLAGVALAVLALAGTSGRSWHRLADPLTPGAAGAGLLTLATGVLLAGGYGVLLLLAARRRVLTGAALAVGCAACVALTDPTPARVALVAAGYAAGLAVAGYAVFDPDGYR